MIRSVLLAATLAATALTPGLTTIDQPGRFGQLQVFPLRHKQQTETGPIQSLMLALNKGQVEIREIQGEATHTDVPVQQPNLPFNQTDNQVQQQIPQQIQQAGGGGAQVNALEVENMGDAPVLMLAGTLVKGGRQDRQIGEDVIIPPKQTLKVTAFCIEHGRWNNERDGQNTGGRFKALPILANQVVRYAGQHLTNQSQVWDQIKQLNAKQGKAPATGTLLASLEDGKIEANRAQLATDIQAFLKTRSRPHEIVGLAVAAHGQIRGARWFANRNLYVQFQEALINSAILDSLTDVPGTDVTLPPVLALDVNRLLLSLQRAPVKETRNNGSGTELLIRQIPTGALTETVFDWNGKKVPLSTDVITTH